MVFECIYCKGMLFRDEIIQPGTLAQPSSHMCCNSKGTLTHAGVARGRYVVARVPHAPTTPFDDNVLAKIGWISARQPSHASQLQT